MQIWASLRERGMAGDVALRPGVGGPQAGDRQSLQGPQGEGPGHSLVQAPAICRELEVSISQVSTCVEATPPRPRRWPQARGYSRNEKHSPY